MRREGRATTRDPRHFSMIRDFHLADVITLANGACGTAAIFFAMDHVREHAWARSMRRACWLWWRSSSTCWTGASRAGATRASALGRELDSLADVISFGVAPACLAFALGMTRLWDALVLLYFVACGISRLARYNVTADALAADGGKVTYFEGTPIPTSVAACSRCCWPGWAVWDRRCPRHRGASAPGACTRWCSCSRCPAR